MIFVELALLISILIQSIEWIYLSVKRIIPRYFVYPVAVLLVSSFGFMFLESPLFVALAVLSYATIAWLFYGGFNGGSDHMTMIGLQSLLLTRIFADDLGIKIGLSYWSIQIMFSYFVPGLRKLRNKDWRNASALQFFLRSSTYQSKLSNRILPTLSNKPISSITHWMIILFELVFPISIFLPLSAFWVFLAIGFCFHLAVTFLFKLNRFFWAWTAGYAALALFKIYLL